MYSLEIGTEAEWELNKEISSHHICVNSVNPVLYRIDSKDHFVWKIKNIPYPRDYYSIEVEKNTIILKTTNCKYHKKITVPDMDRFGYTIKVDDITYLHHENVLTIMLAKPKEIVDCEQNILNEVEQHAIAVAENNPIPESAAMNAPLP